MDNKSPAHAGFQVLGYTGVTAIDAILAAQHKNEEPVREHTKIQEGIKDYA